jgi:hypothetical protein
MMYDFKQLINNSSIFGNWLELTIFIEFQTVNALEDQQGIYENQ